MDPIPVEVFEKVPKVLWESARMGYNKNHFLVAIKNGANFSVQVVTPEHMKQLVQMFVFNLAQYEKEHGQVSAEWSPNVKSPIQFPQPPKEGDGKTQ